MGFPGAKVHRTSRRKLGRGQYPVSVAATATLTNPSANVVQVTFSAPVAITGTIPLQTSTGTMVNQQISSGTVATQTFNTSQATATVTLANNASNIRTYQGGGVAGTTVVF